MWPSPILATAVWTTLGEFSLSERLAVTAAAVAAALVSVLVPVARRQTAAFVDRRMPPGRLRRVGERLSDYVPTTLGVLWTRFVQVGVVLAAGLVVVTVWKQGETVHGLMTAVGITPGLLVRIVITVGLFFGASIADSPPPQAVPKRFGDSAVVLELRFWIDNPTPPGRWRAISAVVEAVKDAFDREDIKIPSPQRELPNRPATGEQPLKAADAPGEVEPRPED